MIFNAKYCQKLRSSLFPDVGEHGVKLKNSFMKKIENRSSEVIYLSIVIVCVFFYLFSSMMSISMAGLFRIYSVAPAGLLFIFPFLYLLLNVKRVWFKDRAVGNFVALEIGVFIVSMAFADEPSIKKMLYNMFILLVVPLTFLYGYTAFRRWDLEQVFSTLTGLLLGALFCVYYYIYRYINFGGAGEYASLNVAYYPMLVLPCVLCSKSRLLKNGAIGLVSVAVFSSMKRGGLIALALSLTVYFIVDKIMIQERRLKASSLIVVALLLGSFLIAFKWYDTSTGNQFSSRLESIQEDRGSMRLDVYEETFEMIRESDSFGLIFGHGDNAVLRDSSLELSAHNDFLEVLYDYGVVLFLIYVLFHFRLFVIARRLIRKRSLLAPAFAMSYVQFLFLSMVSHVFIYSYFILFTLFWGMAIGSAERDRYRI